MNKTTNNNNNNNTKNTFLFVLLFLVNTVAYCQEQSVQQLNTLDEYGYSTLHYLIIDTELNQVPYYVQAIKQAKLDPYGKLFYGQGGNEPDLIMISWNADLYTKEDILKTLFAGVKEEIDERIKKINALVASGALVDLPDSYGRTALWWAAERNQPELISALIELGASVNGTNGYIPLNIAASCGNKESVNILLEKGANPNLADPDGDTPLHDAARGENWIYPTQSPEYRKIRPERLQDYKDTVTLLMNHGATNTVKNRDGLTPSQLARKQQLEFYPEIEQYELADYIDSQVHTANYFKKVMLYAKKKLKQMHDQLKHLLS